MQLDSSSTKKHFTNKHVSIETKEVFGNFFFKATKSENSYVVVFFVSVFNAMHVGVLREEYFCNIPLGDYQL